MPFLRPRSWALSVAVLCLVTLHFSHELIKTRREQAIHRVNRATVDAIVRQHGGTAPGFPCQKPDAPSGPPTSCRTSTDDSLGPQCPWEEDDPTTPQRTGTPPPPPNPGPSPQPPGPFHLINAAVVQAVADAQGQWERMYGMRRVAPGDADRRGAPSGPPSVSFDVRLFPRGRGSHPTWSGWTEGGGGGRTAQGSPALVFQILRDALAPPPLRPPGATAESPGKMRSWLSGLVLLAGGTGRRDDDEGYGCTAPPESSTVPGPGRELGNDGGVNPSASGGGGDDGSGSGGGGGGSSSNLYGSTMLRSLARLLAPLPLSPERKYDLSYAVQIQLAALMPRAALLLAPALSSAGLLLPVMEARDARRLPAFTHPRVLDGATQAAPGAGSAFEDQAVAVCHLETSLELQQLALGMGPGGVRLTRSLRRARCSLRLRPDLAGGGSCRGGGTSAAGGPSEPLTGSTSLEVLVWEAHDVYARAAAAAAAAAATTSRASSYGRRLYGSSWRYMQGAAAAAAPPGWFRGGFTIGLGGGAGAASWWRNVMSYLHGNHSCTMYFCAGALCDPSVFTSYQGVPQARLHALGSFLQLPADFRTVSELTLSLLLPHAEVMRWLWPLHPEGLSLDLIIVSTAAMACCFAEWLLVAHLGERWLADLEDLWGPQLDSHTAAAMRTRVWMEAVEGPALRTALRDALPPRLAALLALHSALGPRPVWPTAPRATAAAAARGSGLLLVWLPASLVLEGLRLVGWWGQRWGLLKAAVNRIRAVDVATRASKQLLQVAVTARMMHDCVACLTLREVAAAASLEDAAALGAPGDFLGASLPGPEATTYVRRAVRWFRGGGGAAQRIDLQRRQRQQQQQQQQQEQRQRQQQRRQAEEEAEGEAEGELAAGARRGAAREPTSVRWPEPLKLGALPGGDFEADGGPGGSEVCIPRGFVCSITHCVMRQPALLLSPQLPSAPTYERAAVQEWLRQSLTDPRTNIVLRSYTLVPNDNLRRAIEEWAADLVALRTAAATPSADHDQPQQRRRPRRAGTHEAASNDAAVGGNSAAARELRGER